MRSGKVGTSARLAAAAALAVVVLLPVPGCAGYKVKPAWIGDGGGDPDASESRAFSDRGFGRDTARGVEGGFR